MRVPLLGGFYQAKGYVANSQRCVNLYPENNPQNSQAPSPVTHYPTPGTTLLGTAPNGKVIVRCLYRASNGSLYAVIGNTAYYISPSFAFTTLGTLLNNLTTPVSMSDNGTSLIIVDGTANGYTVTLMTNTFSVLTSPSFYGAARTDYLDTFLIFNQPNTSNFYTTLSNSLTFDPLYIAGKVGYPDLLTSLIVMHREIWLVGTLTTEVWYNSGAADFPFQEMPGAFIEHGNAAPYSLAAQDLCVYWLSQDKQGQAIVLRGSGYQVRRISTHAIEQVLSTYSTISDAIGFTYQQGGHTFYQLTFPTANATWVYDESTQLWHQRAWLDKNGVLNRHRANCCANAYGMVIVGDFQNGNIYSLDPNNYTDYVDGTGGYANGTYPIPRIRSFPHAIQDSKRITYTQFIADMDVGTDDGSVDGSTSTNPPKILLRWSDDKGRTYGNYVQQSLGSGGQYGVNIQWQRCGMGRDRVFELSWSAPVATALNGAFVDTVIHGT